MKQNNETEQRIRNAARKLFAIKGYRGTTTEDIAREANVNKASLHYYFRSKDKLFDLIFNEALASVSHSLITILNDSINFETKIKRIIAAYIDILIEHPYIPDFIIHELSSNPDRLEKIRMSHPALFNYYLRFQVEIREELQARNISHISPFELILNIISLSVFPFLGKPVITCISDSFGDFRFKQLMHKRKTDIAELILKSINHE